MPEDCQGMKLAVEWTQVSSYTYSTIYIALFIEHSMEVTLH